MKQIFTKFLVAGALVLASLFAVTTVNAQPTYAAGETTTGTNNNTSDHELGSCRYLLGMVSWDCGVGDFSDQTQLATNIWIIAMNVLTDMSVIAAYLVLGYIIYGGYLYILSSGDTNKVAGGKKTLTRAITGIIIVLLSNVILSTIRIALLGETGALYEDCITTANCAGTDALSLVTNLLQWFIGTAGVVAVIFVVIGGVSYATSAGDSSKLQKAKNTIIYALIGLAVVALAEIITATVSNIAREAGQAQVNTTLIAKEQNEKIH